ncbi:hypothetical protein HMPREF0063_11845 [Aeromicrobium marinum DSM 15272]|uniref:Uncharacterized protein n=1 Tax=Aeromicrobium marinum DSM 15272 TaxID=585531 RepID=E2SDQ9_9ACTN|nr:hypothetical protein HMPREF0063_11845 [Aeromicrobium marinum DSM 15272]
MVGGGHAVSVRTRHRPMCQRRCHDTRGMPIGEPNVMHALHLG